MISAKGLSREFVSGDQRVIAVRDVNLSIQDGVFAAVVGPSGSGKSTLLSVLGTLDRPTAGTIDIDGIDVTALSESELTAYRRDKIGFVFQSYNLIPNLSALENVTLPMEFAGVTSHERRERAGRLLEKVGLSQEKHGRHPGRLSGGEQQRVAIARALANRPSLVLADEPTGNLDSETGALIVSLLHDLARDEKTAIVAVTHDPDVAAEADMTFRLVDGRLTDADAFESAIAHSNSAYEKWLKHRDEEHLARFVYALEGLVAAAPSDRRLSSAKIRARFAEAAEQAPVARILRSLDSADLFEDASE